MQPDVPAVILPITIIAIGRQSMVGIAAEDFAKSLIFP
jgi:hypothetical protein